MYVHTNTNTYFETVATVVHAYAGTFFYYENQLIILGWL